jgi:type II secretory pathway pseudopilin PulG
MSARPRSAFTLFQLLTVLAILAIGFALFLPALAKVRAAAARTQSANNLKQIAIGALSAYDTNNVLPAGCDANGFSTAAYLLPYIEQQNVYQMIDFKKSVDDKANAQARAAQIKTYTSPMDPITQTNKDFGATNYLFNAGSKAALKDNDGVFYLESKTHLPDIADGTSNTLLAVETLKGDGVDAPESADVRRQHILLKKESVQGIKDDAGVSYFKENTRLASDRCSSWMDGRFLQGTFNARLGINDAKPDVNCGGVGGVSSMRTLVEGLNAGMCDGSVRYISNKISVTTWRSAATRSGGEVLGQDF